MIAVTGANGFLGSHLVDNLLSKGERVAAVVRGSSDLKWLEGKPVEIRRADLLDSASLAPAIADARLIFHVAGVTRTATIEQFMQGNRDATLALARCALDSAPRMERFVFVSSLAAAGPASDLVPLDESAPLKPVSSYGESKKQAEEGLAAVPGLPLTVVRPPIVYGPRDINLLALFRSVKRRRIIPIVGRGLQKLCFVHATDLAEGIASAGMSSAANGRTYFLTGQEADWRAAAAAFDEAIGKHVYRIRVPRLALRIAGELFEIKAKITGVPQAINRRKVKEMLQPCWTCSGAAAGADFGFEPRFDLARGFADTMHWYEEHGWV